MSRNPSWRLCLYEALTQAILVLGCLREHMLAHGWQTTMKARTFDVYREEYWYCCDCGLGHKVEYFGPDHACGHVAEHPDEPIVGHAYPIRPAGYGYRLRALAGKPSLAKEAR